MAKFFSGISWPPGGPHTAGLCVVGVLAGWVKLARCASPLRSLAHTRCVLVQWYGASLAAFLLWVIAALDRQPSQPRRAVVVRRSFVVVNASASFYDPPPPRPSRVVVRAVSCPFSRKDYGRSLTPTENRSRGRSAPSFKLSRTVARRWFPPENNPEAVMKRGSVTCSWVTWPRSAPCRQQVSVCQAELISRCRTVRSQYELVLRQPGALLLPRPGGWSNWRTLSGVAPRSATSGQHRLPAPTPASARQLRRHLRLCRHVRWILGCDRQSWTTERQRRQLLRRHRQDRVPPRLVLRFRWRATTSAGRCDARHCIPVEKHCPVSHTYARRLLSSVHAKRRGRLPAYGVEANRKRKWRPSRFAVRQHRRRRTSGPDDSEQTAGSGNCFRFRFGSPPRRVGPVRL